jgi:hypothetical protein
MLEYPHAPSVTAEAQVADEHLPEQPDELVALQSSDAMAN